MANEALKNEIRFLQHSIKHNGKKIRVRYSKGNYHPASGLPENTITIYAKEYGNQLPSELTPINETDGMTDYFEKDRARIKPKSKHYKAVERALMKQQAHNDKILKRRYG